MQTVLLLKQLSVIDSNIPVFADPIDKGVSGLNR